MAILSFTTSYDSVDYSHLLSSHSLDRLDNAYVDIHWSRYNNASLITMFYAV